MAWEAPEGPLVPEGGWKFIFKTPFICMSPQVALTKDPNLGTQTTEVPCACSVLRQGLMCLMLASNSLCS